MLKALYEYFHKLFLKVQCQEAGLGGERNNCTDNATERHGTSTNKEDGVDADAKCHGQDQKSVQEPVKVTHSDSVVGVKYFLSLILKGCFMLHRL